MSSKAFYLVERLTHLLDEAAASSPAMASTTPAGSSKPDTASTTPANQSSPTTASTTPANPSSSVKP